MDLRGPQLLVLNLVSATELAMTDEAEVNGGITYIHVARGQSSPSDLTQGSQSPSLTMCFGGCG